MTTTVATYAPPPTYAEVILPDATGKGRFNPIWLKWFLDLTSASHNISLSSSNAWTSLNTWTVTTNVTRSSSPTPFNFTHYDQDVLTGANDYSTTLLIANVSTNGQGGRRALGAALSVSNPVAGGNHNFAACGLEAELKSTDAAAGLFGCKTHVALDAGMTAFNITGLEISISSRAASSVLALKSGIQIASYSDDAVQGTLYDAAVMISGVTGCVGWKNGICFAPATSANPMNANGTLISTVGGATVSCGINFQSYTFSDVAVRLPDVAIGASNALFVIGATGPYYSGFAPAAGPIGKIYFNIDATRYALAVYNP